jgi:hypothetical protein
MIQLLPTRTPELISAALNHLQMQTGMPARASQSWGPASRVQTDSDGQPIQQYLTLLVRSSGGKYLLVRQIVDLERISRRTPSVIELSEKAAQSLIRELELESAE